MAYPPPTVLAALSFLLSCGRAAPPSNEPVSTPGIGPAYSSASPDPALDARAADIRGSCAFARPPGTASEYPRREIIASARGGWQGVRATATFSPDSPDDRSNLLGEIRAGTLVYAAGPLASGTGGTIGFAVLIRDPAGLVCRGYIRATAFERR